MESNTNAKIKNSRKLSYERMNSSFLLIILLFCLTHLALKNASLEPEVWQLNNGKEREKTNEEVFARMSTGNTWRLQSLAPDTHVNRTLSDRVRECAKLIKVLNASLSLHGKSFHYFLTTSTPCNSNWFGLVRGKACAKENAISLHL